MSILNTINPTSSSGLLGDGMPKGTIVIWSGSADNIPFGWHICDGASGTPDLRGRFVLGATTELDEDGNTEHPVGSGGGEEKVTLTIEQMPEHRHAYERWNTSNAAKGTGTLNISGSYAGQTDPVGSSHPHNNMPPYYTLCYIMKIINGGTIGGSGNSPLSDIYSTEEVRIGTWIDGKPLYRKSSVTRNILGGTNQRQLISSINNLQYFHAYGQFVGVTSGYTGCVSVPYAGDGVYVSIEFNNPLLNLIYTYGNSTRTYDAFITIEYTKTTDQPETT